MGSGIIAAMNVLFRLAGQVMLERPARGKSFAQLRARLEETGAQIAERFKRVSDTPANRDQLEHVITIERWGANRLRVLLGDKPFELDSSLNYAPQAGLGWNDLLALWTRTRAETLALVARLETGDPTAKVAHNSFGPLSARAWTQYLTTHAEFESRKARA
jgi:hypothetical protein